MRKGCQDRQVDLGDRKFLIRYDEAGKEVSREEMRKRALCRACSRHRALAVLAGRPKPRLTTRPSRRWLSSTSPATSPCSRTWVAARRAPPTSWRCASV